MRKQTRQSGFTLIELLIVFMCLSALVLPVMYLEVYSSERLHQNLYRQQMMEDGNLTIQWISRDLRSGKVLPDWNDQALATDRLIVSVDNGAAVYSLDRTTRVLTRVVSAKGGAGRTTFRAAYVDEFTVMPVEAGARVIEARVVLSRRLVKAVETVTVDGVAARRTP